MCDSGRLWSGPTAQEVAEDMFNNAALIVENEGEAPRDACHPKPDWNRPLRCYSPVMYNAEVNCPFSFCSTLLSPALTEQPSLLVLHCSVLLKPALCNAEGTPQCT